MTFIFDDDKYFFAMVHIFPFIFMYSNFLLCAENSRVLYRNTIYYYILIYSIQYNNNATIATKKL